MPFETDDLVGELSLLQGLLATSGSWTRSALEVAARESPWFVAEVARLTPPARPSIGISIAVGLALGLGSMQLSAQARINDDPVAHDVLGHTPIDGEVFEFRNGEVVWSDNGRVVTKWQLGAMDRDTKTQFYGSMGLSAPPDVVEAAPSELQPKGGVKAGRIRIYRDGREAPVLAEIRQMVALRRQEHQTALLAQIGLVQVAAAPPAVRVGGVSPEASDGAPPVVAQGASVFQDIWVQVALERAAAKAAGVAPPPAVATTAAAPKTVFQQIWAEVTAERAALRGDGVVGTYASTEPEEADGPMPAADANATEAVTTDVPTDRAASREAGDAPIPDLVDAPATDNEQVDVPAVQPIASGAGVPQS